MVSVWIAYEGDSGINDLPGLLIYPLIMGELYCWRLRYHLLEGHEEGILVGWLPGREEQEPCAHPKVALVLPHIFAAEASQNQVVVRFVPGVPNRNILEETAVCPKDVVHPIPNLLDATEHAPHPAIPLPVEITREEMLRHVLQNLRRQHRCDGLVAFLSVWDHYIRLKIPGDKDIRAPGALANIRHNVLQGGGIVWCKIASNNVPAAPSCLQL